MRAGAEVGAASAGRSAARRWRDNRDMNRDHTLFHLREVAEEFQPTIGELDADPTDPLAR